MRQFEMLSRSPVRGCNGMISSANPLASLAGVDVLRSGGNAVDAAIATMAVLGVVEPLNLGLGGDCFALYAPGGTEKIIAYNGSGRAPATAHADWYRSRGYTEIPAVGPHCVTIPGAVEAWERLADDYGTRGLDELLRPAIHYAEAGYPVHDVIAAWWRNDVNKLKADEEARQRRYFGMANPHQPAQFIDNRTWQQPWAESPLKVLPVFMRAMWPKRSSSIYTLRVAFIPSTILPLIRASM